MKTHKELLYWASQYLIAMSSPQVDSYGVPIDSPYKDLPDFDTLLEDICRSLPEHYVEDK